MRDIQQIAEQNAKASQNEIASANAAGRHAVAHYTGLHYISHEEFETREQADKHAADIEAQGGSNHAKVFSPAAAHA